MNPGEVQLYKVVPGKLFAGEYPSAIDPEIGARRLDFVVGKGVATFIDLTASHDRLEPYSDMLPAAGEDLKHLSFPIPDMGVPESGEVMKSVLEAIRSETEAGRVCYVHCWGGIGRTGTAIGCYFREQGMAGDEALAKVQKLYAEGMPKVVRNPYSPQTRPQCDYVRGWGV